MKAMEYSTAVLRHLVWRGTGQRPSPDMTRAELLAVMRLTLDVRASPLDERRREIVDFLEANKHRLSFPCHGNCFQHTDITVIFCHNQLKQELGER